MKYICIPVLLLLLFAATLWGATSGGEYVRIYSLIQQGETLESANHPVEAYAAFLDAQKGLIRLQKSAPDWNPKVVDFRLRYLQTKLAQLAPVAAVPPQETPGPGSAAAAAAQSPKGTSEVASELEATMRELQQLRSENSSLQTKLREALSIRPAPVDPEALTRAEQRNAELNKEIETLKSRLEEVRVELQQAADPEALKEARSALEKESQRADQLAAERAALVEQVSALKTSAEVTATLRDENELLRSELNALQSKVEAAGDPDLQQRLDQVTTELALLRSESDILRLEKSALEQRMQGMRDRPSTSATAFAAELSESKSRVQHLERERSQLRVQLAQANQKLADQSMALVGEPTGLGQAEVERLKARLAVYEAEKVPFSVEELALMRMSTVLSPSDASKPIPPTGVGQLVAQAERQFKQGQFQEAESTLRQILSKDDNNAFTLSNLAATQIEQGKDAEAEVNLQKALAGAPRDPFSLATMGILKFRDQQYEQALDYLGLAAQYDPKNAVIHNYLGMALSEQGMRGPAETALRRAVQLQPGFGDAHFNLALVYILQDPPLPELARWHYQKALGVGHPRSTEMEQLLDNPGTN